MASDTEIVIDLPNVEVSESFFNNLDKYFESIGFTPCLLFGGMFGKDWAMRWDPEPVNDWFVIDLADRINIYEKGNTIKLAYGTSERTGTYLNIDVHYSDRMKVDYLAIETCTNGGSTFYNEQRKDIWIRCEYIVNIIHNELHALKTTANIEGWEEPWFYIRKNEKKKLDELLIDDCKKPHLLLWAENKSSEALDYRTGTESDMFPVPSKSKPVKPIEFEDVNRAFFLTYFESDVKKEKILLRNCLCCGGLLPQSLINFHYASPSEEEIEKFRDIAWKGVNLKGVVEKLGDPDFRLGGVKYKQSQEKDGINYDIKDMICYTHISDNAVVIFKEYEAGIVVVNYAGKAKLSIVK